MKTLGERLKFVQKRTGKTLPDFAKSLRISRDSLINYQKNRTNPDSRLLSTLCEMYRINPVWLLLGKGDFRLCDEGKEDRPPEIIIAPELRILTKAEARREVGFFRERDYYRAVPVLADPIAAGPPRLVTPDDYSDFVIVFAGWASETNYALRIKGDSMLPLLQTGDLVGLSPWQGDLFALKQQRGKIMGFWLPEPDAGLTVKRLNLDAHHLILEPINPSYLNTYIDLPEIEHLRIYTVNWWCCHRP